MSVPTRGEAFSKLLHHIGEAQSAAAILSHLHNTEDSPHDKAAAKGWYIISEQLKRFTKVVTDMAMRGLQ